MGSDKHLYTAQKFHLHLLSYNLHRKPQAVDDPSSLHSVYKQKKQSAKSLHNFNKTRTKCDKVLINCNNKKDYKTAACTSKYSNASNNLTDNPKKCENNFIKSEVNQLVTNATSSIIEKACIDDSDSGDKECNGERAQSEPFKSDSSETKSSLHLGSNQRK